MAMVPYTYKGVVQSVYDADSIHITLDLGFGLENTGVSKKFPGVMVRLLGCNARELGTPGSTEARDAVRELLPPGTEVLVRSVSWDKYGGRINADVELMDGTDLSHLLIRLQWVSPWDGTGERPVPPWPRTV